MSPFRREWGLIYFNGRREIYSCSEFPKRNSENLFSTEIASINRYSQLDGNEDRSEWENLHTRIYLPEKDLFISKFKNGMKERWILVPFGWDWASFLSRAAGAELKMQSSFCFRKTYSNFNSILLSFFFHGIGSCWRALNISHPEFSESRHLHHLERLEFWRAEFSLPIIRFNHITEKFGSTLNLNWIR